MALVNGKIEDRRNGTTSSSLFLFPFFRIRPSSRTSRRSRSPPTRRPGTTSCTRARDTSPDCHWPSCYSARASSSCTSWRRSSICPRSPASTAAAWTMKTRTSASCRGRSPSGDPREANQATAASTPRRGGSRSNAPWRRPTLVSNQSLVVRAR